MYHFRAVAMGICVYVYMSDASPVSYDYRQSDVYQQLMNTSPHTDKSVKMFDTKWKPFRDTYVDSVRMALQKDTIIVYSYGNGNIYTFE